MDALKEEIYTIDDIYALPDGKRAELIDGKIYYMVPPGRTHQQFQRSISVLMKICRARVKPQALKIFLESSEYYSSSLVLPARYRGRFVIALSFRLSKTKSLNWSSLSKADSGCSVFETL